MKVWIPGMAFLALMSLSASAQNIRGKVIDSDSGEPLFAASVVEKGTANGATTDFEGEFSLVANRLPATLVVQYLGYATQEVMVQQASGRITIRMTAEDTEIGGVTVTGERITEKQKKSPLTVESMDLLAIKECPTGNFYEGLGNLKGVDLTTASLGFRIINTRGFNSTSPVRSLQVIDGIDNQSPGLNFSLGNFLGACDADVKSCDIIAGASSAFYGPGAFNGVISMETKSPFVFPGFSYNVKVGERRLFEQGFRFAEVLRNRDGHDAVGYKVNLFLMRAYDWEATNYGPVYDGESDAGNPGRFDAVNIYGDEYFAANDYRTAAPWGNYRGLELFHRTGYRESDLVDYNTRNLKANAAAHIRLNPEKTFESPELVIACNLGNGNTVFQGDNRFALRDISFVQQKVELRKKDEWFIRAYRTAEDAGRSYDPYATALRLLNEARSNEDWAQVYVKFWNDSIKDQLDDAGYPLLQQNPEWQPGDPLDTYFLPYNYETLDAWLDDNADSLSSWHNQVAQWTNNGNANIPGIQETGYFEPGSAAFQEHFNRLISARNNDTEEGTRFYDKSKLYHVAGEKVFRPGFADELRVGGNMRWYTPQSDGTIFSDSLIWRVDGADSVRVRNRIVNSEYGIYAGVEEKLVEDRLILNVTLRMDKNQNFDPVFTPAASAVYNVHDDIFLRLSFSSGVRNPTLTDQYLYLNVGPAILSGNLNGADSLITLSSFYDYRSTLNPDTVTYFNIDPIRPEQARTLEAGVRGSLGDRLYADFNAYTTWYRDFIGFNIGIDATFDPGTGLPEDIQVYRYSANSRALVRTSGLGVGLNYYLGDYLTLSGNYNWNKLLKTDEDDPIIPAFNTPEHKFNLGLTGRGYAAGKRSGNTLGFAVFYKWIQGFLFEGSPQFTGFVPTYDLVDAQVNLTVDEIDCNFKLGCSNLLNNKSIQTFGGPEIGRLAYFSIVYELANLP
jgi:outer membrane receptor protein involved in Fe transport